MTHTNLANFKPTNPKDALGVKKIPTSVVPQAVVAEVGVGMLEGALKYGAYNWRTAGVRASVYYDAARRHLDSFWMGEDIDPDSGLSHITKAICSLMVLRDAMIHDNVNDDRPPKTSPDHARMLNARCASLIDRHSSKGGDNDSHEY